MTKPAVLLTLSRGIERLASALLDRADIEIVTMYDSTLDVLRNRGIPHRRLLDFVTPAQQARSLAEANRRAATIERVLTSEAFRNAWPAYTGDPATWQALLERTQASISHYLYPEMILSDAIRSCASEMDLRLIVVHQDISNDMRLAIQMGHRLGIPALHTLHGYPCGAIGAISLFEPPSADVLAVFSEHSHAFFLRLGVPGERLAITGNFEWDIYTKPPRPSFRGEACAAAGVDPARPILVYAMTYTHQFSRTSAAKPQYVRRITEAVLKAFGALAARHPDWQFVLRPHPNDIHAPDDLREQATHLGLRHVFVDSTTSAISCATMADLIVCTQSTIGVEGVMLGKPVVNCVLDDVAGDVFNEGMGALYTDDDAIVSVRHEAALAPAIEMALCDPAARQRFIERRPSTLRRFNGAHDGHATERLCDLVLSLMQDGLRLVPPLDRFPDIEPALCEAVPGEARRVRVLGRGAAHVADRLSSARPHLSVETPDEDENAPYDAVVCAEPLPHSAKAQELLAHARALLNEEGAVVATFRAGTSAPAREGYERGAWAPTRAGFEAPCAVGEYTERGIALTLHRAGLALETVAHPPHADLCAVRARVLSGRAGAAPAERQIRAQQQNARGERLFAEGQYAQAAAAFASAIAEYDREALFYSNLGTTLHALGDKEQAWRRFIEALHIDAYCQPARENLRLLSHELGRQEEADHILRLFGADAAEAHT